MQTEEILESQQPTGANRRAATRFVVDGAATLLIVKHCHSVSCQIVDLSMGGCRIQTFEPLIVAPQAPVEVAFNVRGLLFRFHGTTQWTDGRCGVGVHFVDLTTRRQNDLIEFLREIEEYERAATQRAAEEQARLELESSSVHDEAETPPSSLVSTPEPAACPAEDPPAGPPPQVESLASGPAPVKEGPKDRRIQARFEVCDSAVVHLIRGGAGLHGQILDLSLTGCRIRTIAHFPVGIYTPVEAEFKLQGQPFRIGGVVQAIHDRHQVGIRFLDLTDRKRQQVESLVLDIQEMRDIPPESAALVQPNNSQVA